MRMKPRMLLLSVLPFLFTACTNMSSSGHYNSDGAYVPAKTYNNAEYESRLPQQINTNGQRVVVVDPSVHAWGAYSPDGQLVRGGIATAGDNWCDDIHRPCRTSVGTFRVSRMGGGDCKSKTFPLPNGGGLMPYCMFFNNGQALHGSPDNAVVEANVSHGCVRMRIPDAEWLRNNFVSTGTKVIVQPY